MAHPVTIENDHISMEVWPTLGGKVSGIIDKADGFQLLFNYPAEIPDSPRYDSPYADSWIAGWDECFPAVAPGKYVGHPYDGIPIPDHGELWGIPTTAVPTKNGITTVWHGLRFGYRLARKLYLEENSIIAEYTAVNLAPFDFRFVWAQHALMSLASPVELQYEAGNPFHVDLNGDLTHARGPMDWPTTSVGSNLSLPNNLAQKSAWMIYSQDPIDAPFTISYPNRKRKIEISYSSEDEVAAYWGIWINIGMLGSHTHFAVEPVTGRHDYLDRAIKDGSAGRIPPSGRVSWGVRWTLS